jgi:prepilin peptidase CpaA
MEDLLAAPLPANIALATLFAALAISVVTDLRQRLILNAVIYPALAIVAASLLWLGGLGLLAEAALGVLVCAGPFALMMLRGWMGAGDVKLMAVAGAVSGAAAGWPFSLAVLFYVAIAGGVQSALWMLAAKLRGHERPKYVPYGIAIATGTAVAFLWGRSHLQAVP